MGQMAFFTAPTDEFVEGSGQYGIAVLVQLGFVIDAREELRRLAQVKFDVF